MESNMENSLGHTFIKEPDHAMGYLVCSKCEIIVFNYIKDKFMISNRSPVVKYLNDGKILTCDEVLIKKSLE
jgi:hypothetical protein